MHIRVDSCRDIVSDIKKQLAVHKINIDINPAWVDGGDILYSGNSMPIIKFKRFGKGIVLVIGDDNIFIKKNFRTRGHYLTALQCEIVSALLTKDAGMLKKIDWDYLRNRF